jgi:hypothetical protein
MCPGRTRLFWSGRWESNPRPHAAKRRCFARQHFGETFNAPFRSRVGSATRRSDPKWVKPNNLKSPCNSFPIKWGRTQIRVTLASKGLKFFRELLHDGLPTPFHCLSWLGDQALLHSCPKMQPVRSRDPVASVESLVVSFGSWVGASDRSAYRQVASGCSLPISTM